MRLATAVGLVCAAAALVASSEAVHGEVLRVLAAASAIVERHEVLGAVVFTALAAISATFAFFSSAAIVPVAVYAWGAVATAALLWAGWILGGAAAYGLGRALGRPAVAALVSASALARFEERVSRHASPGKVLLLQLALPSEAPGYVLGLAHYGFWRYVGVLAVAELPYAVGAVVLGTAFVERRTAVVLAAAGAALLVAAAGLRLVVRRRRARPATTARAGSP